MKQWIESAPGGWKARIRFPNGRGRSKTFRTQRDARAWLRRTLTEIRDGTFIPEASGKIALADWVMHCEATTVDLAAGTRNRRASDLRTGSSPCSVTGRSVRSPSPR